MGRTGTETGVAVTCWSDWPEKSNLSVVRQRGHEGHWSTKSLL